MAVTLYLGPDLTPVRILTKDGAWPNDPDWLGDFNTAEPVDECWGTTGVRRGTGHPLLNMAVYLAAVAGEGLQVAATATIRAFIINKGESFGLKADAPGIRHPASDAVAAFDLSEPFIVTCGKHSKMGVRVTNIVSADAVEIRIAVQEIQ